MALEMRRLGTRHPRGRAMIELIRGSAVLALGFVILSYCFIAMETVG
jgi:hypothetical protein